ncbi:unnamed protein product [Cuscuta campestris]|uniref:Zinc finger LSD1-type domain-containing protein n=1 Tax=Cuscuta campestris TaxID=132261 RepID=A0A484M0G6_9ASTE|nr:unnamed protein product [Cuscuta campestris]
MLRNQGVPDVQIGRKQYEDRPPMGWHSTSSKQPQSCIRSSSELVSDIQVAKNQRIDDGPPRPPGWQLNPQQQRPPESTPLLVPQSAPSSNVQTVVTQDDDGPPPGWQLISSQQKPPLLPQSLAPSAIKDTEKKIKVGRNGETEQQLSTTDWSYTPELPSTPAPPLRSSSSLGSSDIEMASKHQSIKNEDKKLRTDKGPMQPLAPQLPPSVVPTSSEVGQLVCGTCRQLLSYPRGSKWVQCSACRTVNLVLEAHEVGQVKCGGCTVLLMYPYGAPSVKCSSCHFTTRIGAHNRRPHLAAQQARRLRHPPHQRR